MSLISKAIFNGKTLDLSSDLNPISHGGYLILLAMGANLTLFHSPGNLDEYFLGLVWPWSQKQNDSLNGKALEVS